MTNFEKSYKTAYGIISSDPLAEIAVGGKINFGLIDFGSSDAILSSTSVVNWGFFRGALGALLLKYENSFDIVGTAFLVAPGLAITATHVFREDLNFLQSGNIIPYFLGLHEDKLDIWRVTDVTVTSDDDIALLSVSLSSPAVDGHTFWRMGLTTRMPKLGERVTIIGFRREKLLADDGQKHGFAGNLYCAEGSITNIYESHRDPLLVHFPALEIGCGVLGGMSGGVALDKNGLVLGLISTGLECADGKGPTYISWIIKALGRSFIHRWPPGLVSNSTINMLTFDPRLLYIDKREAIQLISDCQLIYAPWC